MQIKYFSTSVQLLDKDRVTCFSNISFSFFTEVAGWTH